MSSVKSPKAFAYVGPEVLHAIHETAVFFGGSACWTQSYSSLSHIVISPHRLTPDEATSALLERLPGLSRLDPPFVVDLRLRPGQWTGTL